MDPMDATPQASFGPVLFVGLTALALITHTDPTPDLPNPSETVQPTVAVLADASEPLSQPAAPRAVLAAQIARAAPTPLSEIRPAELPLAAASPPPLALPAPVVAGGAALPAAPAPTRLHIRLPSAAGAAPVPRARALLERPPPQGVPSGAQRVPLALALPSPAVQSILEARLTAPAALSRPSVPGVRRDVAVVVLQPVGPMVPLPTPELAFAQPRETWRPALPTPKFVAALDARAQAPGLTSAAARAEAFFDSRPRFVVPGGVARPSRDLALDGVPRLVWARVQGLSVNVRRGPGLRFESLTQFDTGQRLIFTGRDGGWARVNALDTPGGPITGWMFMRYIRFE